MSDLIDRQAAIATAISGRVRTLPTTEDGEDWIRVNEVRDSLLSLPSAQPDIDLSGYSDRLWQSAYERGKAEVRKTGKWKLCMLPRGVALFYCSECGFGKYTDDERKYDFCPNCGVEMREEKEDE